MKPKPLIVFLKTRPFFLFLLPCFFVLHGYTENYDFIPVTDSLLLVLIYLTASLALAGVFWLLYRNFMKAAIVSYSFMAYHFFFGSIQDFSRYHFAGTFFSRYSFILPVSFLLFTLLIIWLK